MTKVIGLGYDGFHDSCIASMNYKGEVLEAFSEERLSKVKKDGRFPKKCLELLDINEGDVLCVSTLNDEDFFDAYKKAGIKPSEETVNERKKSLKHLDEIKEKFWKVHFYSHHSCHAASAYYFSGFKEALVITWDAGNNSEPWNFTVSIGKGSKMERVETSLDGTPALNYTAVTAIMGFKPAHHEGKITGLSARGAISEKNMEKLKNILDTHNNALGSIMGFIAEWKNVGSSENVPKLEVRKKIIQKLRKEIELSDEDLANAIQRLLEEQVIEKIKELKEKYSQKNICLAGGIFANVLLNKKIKELGFDNIFIHPAMGDDGLALGACALYLSEKNVQTKPINTAFFGYAISNKVSKEVLERSDLNFYKPEDMETLIAKKLAEGKIVARCVGKMEYGPRALGNRSILCSARDARINDHLNGLLKRSEFMPFAPICLEEDKEKLFKKTEGFLLASKFMTIALDCNDIVFERCPAVVHVDKTARPQIVGEENPRLKNILKKFKEITGEFCLVNTSFNIHESPIVMTEEDALRAFNESKLDYLVLGDYFVERKK